MLSVTAVEIGSSRRRAVVVDDDAGLSGYISLEIAQEAHRLARGGGRRRHIGYGIYDNRGFSYEIQGAFDLTMPETPSDPLDRLGEASASLAISLRGVRPARGCLCDVLNPHREVKPVEDVTSWARAGGLAERSWTIGAIAQDGDGCRWRRPQSMKHTAQLSSLRSCLRWHAGEYDLLRPIVADLSEENLERTPLILTSRTHVAEFDGERNGFRRQRRRLGSRLRDSFLLQPGANTKGSLQGGFHSLWLAEWQKLRQQRPRSPIG